MTSLFIDTHDNFIHLIVFKNGQILDAIHEESKNKHSVLTMPLLDELLTRNHLSTENLNEIYVVNGPGSFTGARLAVTIAKTMAFCLNIPIKVIDSLTLLALQNEVDSQYVSIMDKNGAFVGNFDSKRDIVSMSYYNNSQYKEFLQHHVVFSNLTIDYMKVYQHMQNLPYVSVHEVKPLYVKGISVLNDK